MGMIPTIRKAFGSSSRLFAGGRMYVSRTRSGSLLAL